MCEPATLTAIGTWAASAFSAAGATGAAVAGTAAIGTAATVGTAVATGMTAAQMISLGLAATSAVVGGIGMYNQSKAAKQTAEANAERAETAAQDAVTRGDDEAQRVMRQGAALKSSQRTSMAARGLDLTYGTAADLQDQTDFFTQSDVATTRTNARKEAYNLRSQRNVYQAEAASNRPWLAAGSTMLGAAGQVSDRWYRYTNPRSAY